MRSRIIVALVLAIMAGLGLTACGGGNSPLPRTEFDSSATARPSIPDAGTTTADAAQNIIKVFPAVGTKPAAVEAHGTAASVGTINQLTYTCKPEFESVTAPFLSTVDWNGVIIEWTVPSRNYDAMLKQTMVHIIVHDDQKPSLWRPVAMIVTVTSKDLDSETIRRIDNSVATLGTNEAPNGIRTYELRTLDYGSFGYIADVTFCMPKPTGGA